MRVRRDNNMTICHVVFNKLYILWPHAHAAYLITFHVCIMMNVRLRQCNVCLGTMTSVIT